MNDRQKIEHLRRRTVDAAERVTAGRARSDGSPSLRPGDLFVSPRTSAFPIEWVVLEDDSVGDRLLVIPADTQPLIGRIDVAATDRDGGHLSLRCRHALWIPTAALHGLPATGRLRSTTIDDAKQARITGTISDGTDREVVEDDPEYRDWMEATIGPAIEALGETPGAARDDD